MKFKKVLTLRTIVATSAGLTLASSSFVAAVQVAGFLSGDSAWLAILIAGVFCLAAGMCFSELNDILPSAAGIRLYFGRAFGEKAALTVSLLYMLVVMGVVGAESYILAKILNYAFPSIDPLIWIFFMLASVTLMNIRGIKIAGAFQDVITYGLLVSVMVLSYIGLEKLDFHLAAPLVAGGMDNLFSAVAVGVFLFVGFEWVTPLAEEVTESRLISKGMFIAVGLLSVVYSFFTVVMAANVPREELVNSPMPQLLFARNILGDAGVAWIVVISLASSITTFNAGLISVSRFFYATAREHALPAVFSKISMRYMTPWVSILAVFAVGLTLSVIILFTGKYLVLVNMAAAAECLVYALTGVAVLVLRKKINRERKFIIPWGPVIPLLTTVVFTLLMLGVFATDPYMALWMAIGLGITWWYVSRIVPVLKEKHKAGRVSRRRNQNPESRSQNPE
ncbi:MAG: amino acid transporter [Peptococcaceae bacterium BRH_c4a]|nr:MAG: amino acid transporter [Peptococcaceae bacterium BRH_c4a]